MTTMEGVFVDAVAIQDDVGDVDVPNAVVKEEDDSSDDEEHAVAASNDEGRGSHGVRVEEGKRPRLPLSSGQSFTSHIPIQSIMKTAILCQPKGTPRRRLSIEPAHLPCERAFKTGSRFGMPFLFAIAVLLVLRTAVLGELQYPEGRATRDRERSLEGSGYGIVRPGTQPKQVQRATPEQQALFNRIQSANASDWQLPAGTKIRDMLPAGSIATDLQGRDTIIIYAPEHDPSGGRRAFVTLCEEAFTGHCHNNKGDKDNRWNNYHKIFDWVGAQKLDDGWDKITRPRKYKVQLFQSYYTEVRCQSTFVARTKCPEVCAVQENLCAQLQCSKTSSQHTQQTSWTCVSDGGVS